LRYVAAVNRIGIAATFLCGIGCTSAPTANGLTCESAAEETAPVAPAAPTAAAPTVIYLRRDGVTLTGGADDAAHDTSSVVADHGRTIVELAPAGLDDAVWDDVVSCVRAKYSRFNVRFVTERPSAPGYVMAVFGGTGAELGYGAEVRGAAPMDSSGCRTVDNAVVMVFSAKLGPTAETHCDAAAHEIAHVFSVDHELLAADPSSYLPFSGSREFQDVDAPCGETSQRACICGRPSQNAVAVLLEKLGPAPVTDAEPPTVDAAATPSKRGSLAITVHASDPSGIMAVALTYRDAGTFVSSTCGDGQMPCSVAGSSYTFVITGARGQASFNATATDRAGNSATLPGQVAVDDTPQAPTALAVDVQVASGVATAHATLAGTDGASAGPMAVTLYWTDSRGVTTRHALCPNGASTWSLPIHLDARAGARSAVVVATDRAGNSTISPLTTLLIE
jgi:hypothetical protein